MIRVKCRKDKRDKDEKMAQEEEKGGHVEGRIECFRVG